MDELLSERRPPASSEALKKLADDLPRGLPDELRELLLTANGAKLSADAVLRVPDGSTAGAISILPAEKIASVTRTVLGSGARHTAWARDGNGNVLTVDQDGFVYFWNHDTDEEIPFSSRIRDLGRHFFRRSTAERREGSPTAAALDKMLVELAPLESIEAFLRDALASDTVGAFLMAAARHGRADVVSAITGLVRATDADLARGLGAAVERNQLEVAEALLRHGAEINGMDPRTGMTPLMAAASVGQREAVVFLLDRGADASLMTKRGRTAAQIAMTSTNPQLAELIAARMIR